MVRVTLANAFLAYSDNYLIDTDHGVILDVEAMRPIRQAEVGSTRMMLDRVKAKFELNPERLIADTAYGSGPMLGWLVDRNIAPHIPVIDKAGRTDGTWSRIRIVVGPMAQHGSSSNETLQTTNASALKVRR